MIKRSLSTLLTMAILTLSLPSIYSQVTTASISGALTDQTGARLPQATVKVHHIEMGLERSVISDGQGRYRVSGLTPGSYNVSAELTGFKTEVVRALTLTVGQELTLDFTLKVGEVVENITVVGGPSLLELTNGRLSEVVDDKKIRDLPLNARSFIQLSFLQPGVIEFKFERSTITQGRGPKMIVSGLRPNSNSFLLDGTYVNDAQGRTPGSAAGVFLGIDAVREFRVLTNSFGAEYGHASGGVVSAVTKAGTNDLQGSAFWFHRDDNFDARNFFDLEKPEFRRHQFGGVVGGPVKQDKTFFLGAAEWFRQGKGITRVAFVPSVAARDGRIVPVADSVKPYLSLFPIPNGRDLGGGLAEHRFPQDEVANESFFQIRLDHNFSPNDLFFGRYTFDDAAVQLPATTPNTLAVADELSRNQYVTLEYKRILSAQLLNTARVAFNRTNSSGTPRFLQEVDPSLSFIPGRPLDRLRIGGIGSWGPTESIPVRRLRNLYSLSDDLSYNRGRHAIKSGLILNRFQDNDFLTPFGGAYEFAGIREFLQGRPSRLSTTAPGAISDRAWRQWLFGVYVQDDFNAARGLTLNLGLRYEFTTVLKETHGRVENLRDVLRDAEMTVGDPMYRNPSLRNFAPRVGFAWDVFGTAKAALRGGFGLFFDPYVYASLAPMHLQTPPFVQSGLIRNPTFPRHPLPSSFPSNTQTVSVSEFHPQNPYSMQYTLNFQTEVWTDFVLSAAYAGSRGVNLFRGGDVNRPYPQIVNGRKFFPVGAPLRNPNWARISVRRADGNSWYNALQVSARKRYSRGVQFQVSYTFSRTIDEASGSFRTDLTTGVAESQDTDDRKNERGLAAFHVKHHLVFDYTLALPWFQEQSGVIGRVLGGWQVNGITAIRSGMPLTPGVSSDRARAGLTVQGQLRPDPIPGRSAEEAILGNQGFKRTGRFFDPFLFTLPSPGFLGTLGRNTLIGPDLVSADFSLVKNSRLRLLGENGNIQLRIEFFNLGNRANFSSPNLLVFAGTATMPDPACQPQFECPLPSAGTITGTVTDARQMQLGLKIIF